MKTMLITGAAGTLGSVLCKKALSLGYKVRAMDINECALAQMNYDPQFFTKIYGDFSNYRRSYKALKDVDILLHVGALKNLMITEGNAEDVIRVNVQGTQNLASAAIERGVKHAIFISSDKAVEPSTLYGASKQVGEHIWKSASRIQDHTVFTIVRSGNFFESNGNVFEIWEKQKEKGLPLTITDIDMSRYFIDAEDVADLVLDIPNTPENLNGAVVIPKMQEYSMMELLLMKYGEDQEFVVSGKRQGEKMRERLKMEDEHVWYENSRCEVVR